MDPEWTQMKLEACKTLHDINVLQANWWRRGESNPRPEALRLRHYMLSFVIGFSITIPDEQGKGQRSQLDLTSGY